MAMSTFSRYFDVKNIIDAPKLVNIELPKNIVTKIYTTKQGDRLTTIAWKVFGNSQYYWIIAEINDIIEPEILYGVFEANITLKIPDASLIQELYRA